MNEASRDIYRRRINTVIDRVNAQLDRSWSLDELAAIAGFSKFHFHRVFKCITGEPVSQFVKRLRLEHSVRLLRHSSAGTLTEIAFACGFESSSDFSRSFRQYYGFSPREFSEQRLLKESKIRQELAASRHYPLRHQSTAENPDGFEIRLDSMERFRIAYVRVFGAFDPDRTLTGMHELVDWGRAAGLYPGARLIGMSQDDMDTTPTDKYRYDWCLRVPPQTAAAGSVSVREFPGGLFASVGCVGDINLLDRAWQWLFRDWLPTSGYEPRNEPAMEWYESDPIESDWQTFDLRCCIPIRPL